MSQGLGTDVSGRVGSRAVGGGWDALDAEAYRALFFRCGEGVIFTDPGTGEIVAANPAACELLGYREDELCRVGRDGICDAHDRARWKAALAERGERGTVEAELSFRRADGSSFVAEVTWTLFTDAHGEARACAMLRDVTAQLCRRGRSAAQRGGAAPPDRHLQ
jgi:PAS domain S-box-containing protein